MLNRIVPLAVETLTVGGICVVGVIALGRQRVDKVTLVAAAIATGLSILMVAGVGLALLGLPVRVTTLAPSAFAVAMAIALGRPRSPRPTTEQPGRRRGDVGTIGLIVATMAMTAVFSAAHRLFNTTLSTNDSYGYVMTSGLMHVARLDLLDWYTFNKRMLGYPALNTPAHAAGQAYLPALNTMAGLAIAVLVASATWGFVASRTTRRVAVASSAAAVAVLFSTNFFWFNVLYINSHIVVGLLTSLVVIEILRRDAQAPSGAHGVRIPDAVLVLLLLGLTLTRPEGVLVAILLLRALARATGRTTRSFWLMTASVALAGLIWNVALVWGTDIFAVGRAFAGDRSETTPALMTAAMLVTAIAAGGASLSSSIANWLAKPLTWAPLVVLGAGAVVLADLSTAVTSIAATLQNVYADVGHWGPAMMILLPAVAVVSVARRTSMRVGAVALSEILLLYLALGSLRGGAYRAGAGDSLNRMLMHLYPSMLIVVALTLYSFIIGRDAGERTSPVVQVANDADDSEQHHDTKSSKEGDDMSCKEDATTADG